MSIGHVLTTCAGSIPVANCNYKLDLNKVSNVYNFHLSNMDARLRKTLGFVREDVAPKKQYSRTQEGYRIENIQETGGAYETFIPSPSAVSRVWDDIMLPGHILSFVEGRGYEDIQLPKSQLLMFHEKRAKAPKARKAKSDSETLQKRLSELTIAPTKQQQQEKKKAKQKALARLK